MMKKNIHVCSLQERTLFYKVMLTVYVNMKFHASHTLSESNDYESRIIHNLFFSL